MNDRMDSLQRGLVTLGAVAAMVCVVVYGFVHENFQLLGLALLAAPIVFLINRPGYLAVLVIGLSQSMLTLPTLPQGILLVHLLMVAFILLAVARNILTKAPISRLPACLIALIPFLAVLGLIIVKRGIGFQFLGGDSIGGAFYMKIFLSAGFLFFSRYIQLTTKQWRLAVVLLVLTSFLPVLAQALFTYSGGAITFQYYFIQPYVSGLKDTLEAMNSASGVARFQSLAVAAANLMVLALVFTARGRRFNLVTWLLLGLSLVGFALSGFRSGLIEFACVVGLYIYMTTPPSRRLFMVARLLFAGMFAVVLVIPFIEHMPLSVQRTFSFLPFVEVSSLALDNAEMTTRWRFDLWTYLWGYVPDYLWIGRGFTVSLQDILSYSVSRDPILLYFVSHDYHSGPLALLLDTGLPGTLAAVVFFFFALRDITRPQQFQTDPFLVRFYTVAQSMFIYNIAAFFFIFGDVRDNFPTLFMTLTIILGLRRTERAAAVKIVQTKRLVDPTFGAVIGSG